MDPINKEQTDLYTEEMNKKLINDNKTMDTNRTTNTNESTDINNNKESSENSLYNVKRGIRRGSLQASAKAILKDWMFSPDHFSHPYPTEEEKVHLASKAGIDIKQLSNWFTNARKRIWQPVLRQSGIEVKSLLSTGRGGPRNIQEIQLLLKNSTVNETNPLKKQMDSCTVTLPNVNPVHTSISPSKVKNNNWNKEIDKLKNNNKKDDCIMKNKLDISCDCHKINSKNDLERKSKVILLPQLTQEKKIKRQKVNMDENNWIGMENARLRLRYTLSKTNKRRNVDNKSNNFIINNEFHTSLNMQEKDIYANQHFSIQKNLVAHYISKKHFTNEEVFTAGVLVTLSSTC